MSSKILLMGDFNYSSIDFVNHIVKPGDDSVETKFFNNTKCRATRRRGGAPRPALIEWRGLGPARGGAARHDPAIW